MKKAQVLVGVHNAFVVLLDEIAKCMKVGKRILGDSLAYGHVLVVAVTFLVP